MSFNSVLRILAWLALVHAVKISSYAAAVDSKERISHVAIRNTTKLFLISAPDNKTSRFTLKTMKKGSDEPKNGITNETAENVVKPISEETKGRPKSFDTATNNETETIIITATNNEREILSETKNIVSSGWPQAEINKKEMRSFPNSSRNINDRAYTENGIENKFTTSLHIKNDKQSTVSTSNETTRTTPLENNNSNDGKHYCQRSCVAGQGPLTCIYKFSVEHYYTMSKACHDCPNNASDCERAHCVTADGVRRPIVVVNRLLPGPSIQVCLNDHIVVDVTNHLGSETTSLHWHGHHQQHSPYMDGVPFVSQCPITPNSQFRYSFTANNPGTHFWHSHSGVQRGDGVFGSFVVRTPDSMNPHRYLYDEDLSAHTMIILDWSHELGVSMLTAHYQTGGSNKPQSMIVNGRGRNYSDSEQLTSTSLERFNVEKGKRYRFRVINAGVQNCPIDLSIDKHNLTIISTDGWDVKPLTVGSLVSYAGERWDFILQANADEDNYWIRFTGIMDCVENKVHQVAVLHYEGSNDQEPKEKVGYNIHERRFIQLNSLNVNYTQEGTLSIPHLQAIDIDPEERNYILKKIPDKKIYIDFDFHPKNNPHFHDKENSYGFYDVNETMKVYTPQMNDISMSFTHFPLMSQHEDIKNDTFCDHQKLSTLDCSKTFCQCTNVEKIPLGDVVEIILIDKGEAYNANHPFHLHGHPFRVIGMDRLGEMVSRDTIIQMDKANRLLRNLTCPPLKDTVTVPDGGYTILRVHFTNPGYWLFHCHIEFHAEVGMALIFKVGEHKDFKTVPKGFPRCGDYILGEEPDENLITISYTEPKKNNLFVPFTDWLSFSNGTQVTSRAVSYQCSAVPFIVILLSPFLQI